MAAVIGILLDEYWTPGVAVWFFLFWISVVGVLLTAILTNFLYLKSVKHGDSSKSIPFFLVNIIAWITFASLAGLRYERYLNYFPETEIGLHVPQEGVSVALEFQVQNTPTLFRQENSSQSVIKSDVLTCFNANVSLVKDSGVWKKCSGRIAISIMGDASYLHIGDKVLAFGRLEKPEKQRNPGEQDRSLYYRAQRILTTFSVTSIENLEIKSRMDFNFKTRIARYFETIRIGAGNILTEWLEPRNAAIAKGMTLGFRNDVDDITNDSFRRTGTIHLLAISGLHIAIVVGAFVFILSRVGTPRALVAILTIILVFFYIALTDMRAPVIRAAVLIVTLSIGTLINKRSIPLNTLAFAALVILAWNPCELFQLGAQLSFLATGSFLWTSLLSIREQAMSNSSRRQAIRERNQLFKRSSARKNSNSSERVVGVYRPLRIVIVLKSLLKRVVKSTWRSTTSVAKAGSCIWIIGVPALLRSTNLFSPIAIIANPAIWFPATIALLLAFILIVVGALNYMVPTYFCWFVTIVAYLTNVAFNIFLSILDLFASPAWGACRIPAPPTWTLWLFYVPLLFWTLFPVLRPQKIVLWGGMFLWGGIALLASQFEIYSQKRSEVLCVDVLSVGHGCAVLGLFPDGRTFLYDCGSLYNADHVAEIVAKDLWDANRTRIDVVIISHSDFDHYGGITTLVDLVKVDCVCVSPTMFLKSSNELNELKKKLQVKKISVQTVVAGDSLGTLGFPELAVLHPFVDDVANIDDDSSNANSLVIALEYLNRRVLLPGDLDSDDARFINWNPINFDFILAPHHGGRSKNLDEILTWANPEFIALSGGIRQRSYEMEEELRVKGYKVFHTYDVGRVRVIIKRKKETNAGFLDVQTYR